LKLYEGGFHDLLNDVDKRVVMHDVQDWIGARIHDQQPVRMASQARGDRSESERLQSD
jgi:hypothetical protein